MASFASPTAFATRAVRAAVLATACAASALADAIPWRTQESPAIAAQARAALPADVAGRIQVFAQDANMRHYIVQLSRPVDDALRAELAASGLHLHAYLHANSFFASIDPTADAAALAASPALASVQPIQPSWKLHPLLAAGGIPDWAIVGYVGDNDPVIGAYVLFHPDVDIEANAAPLLPAYGGTVRSDIATVPALVVELPLSQVFNLVTEDAVQWIEPALPLLTPNNAENRALTGANTVQAAPYNLNGAGVKVMVYDAGGVRPDHQDFGGRVTVEDGQPSFYHATHVAGTIGGSGAASGGANRGMAPGVQIFSYTFQFAPGTQFLYTNPGDLATDYNRAINTNLVDIANNSIGSNTESNGFPCVNQGDYGITDVLIDNIVRGSMGRPFRIVWAAGNERQGSRCDVEGFGDYYSTAPPAGAKNQLSIGAVNANDDSMTSFSSWGPTDDGRLKPDFCAPGCQQGGDNGVTSCFDGSTTSYGSICGTSMACPTVTGLGALLLQDYRAQFPGRADPRNSTLKILFAHNAVDRGNPGPDYQFGYGSVRIQPTIDFMRSANFVEESVNQGGAAGYRVTVNPGETQLKITLAWDDFPGTPNVSPAVINDLDLRLVSPSQVTHFPWTLDPQNPSANAVRTVANHRDNTEQVVVDNPQPGVWTVQVSGFNVPQGPQPFSICGSPNLTPTGLRVDVVGSLPTVLPAGQSATVNLNITAFPGETLVPDSPTLHLRYSGAQFAPVPLTHMGGTSYRGTLPPAVCGATPEFYFSAEGVESGEVTNPAGGASNPYSILIGVFETAVSEHFETDPGWTVTNQPNLTTGAWVRGVPSGNGSRGDPSEDFDGSGRCWVTGNGPSEDVDGGGTTTLTTNVYPLPALQDVRVSYAAWMASDDGDDSLTIDFFDTDANDWVRAETIASTGGWQVRGFVVNDLAPDTSSIRLRFITADTNNNSVTEAGIDAFKIEGFACDGGLPDCNGNGILDSDDIASGRSADANGDGVPDECAPADCPGDVNGDNTVDLADLAVLLSNFGVQQDATRQMGDLDADEDVDLSDLARLLSNFGASCE